MALTAKQQRFCDEYLIDLNGTQAAIRAGYAVNSANEQAARLLANDSVKEYIAERQQVLQEKTQLTQEWVLDRLKLISDRCVQAVPVMFFNYETGQMEQRKDAEGNHIWQFDSNGANKATELIGKHLGMFVQKVDLTTKGDSLNDKRPSVKLPDGTYLEI